MSTNAVAAAQGYQKEDLLTFLCNRQYVSSTGRPQTISQPGQGQERPHPMGRPKGSKDDRLCTFASSHARRVSRNGQFPLLERCVRLALLALLEPNDVLTTTKRERKKDRTREQKKMKDESSSPGWRSIVYQQPLSISLSPTDKWSLASRVFGCSGVIRLVESIVNVTSLTIMNGQTDVAAEGSLDPMRRFGCHWHSWCCVGVLFYFFFSLGLFFLFEVI